MDRGNSHTRQDNTSKAVKREKTVACHVDELKMEEEFKFAPEVNPGSAAGCCERESRAAAPTSGVERQEQDAGGSGRPDRPEPRAASISTTGNRSQSSSPIPNTSGLRRVVVGAATSWPAPAGDAHESTDSSEDEDVSVPSDATPRCVDCGLDCGDDRQLAQHRRQQHVDKKPYRCPRSQCGKCFRTPHKLAEHSRPYSIKKQFCCSECMSSFRRKDHLLEHLFVHTGLKPFKCTQCEYSSSRKQRLVEHARIHTGEKPYCCSECNMRFSRKRSLVSHQRTHTSDGERPFCCPFCPKCFTYSSHLMSHMQTHPQ